MKAYFVNKEIQRRYRRLSKNRQRQVKSIAQWDAERRPSSEDWKPELYAVMPHHFR